MPVARWLAGRLPFRWRIAYLLTASTALIIALLLVIVTVLEIREARGIFSRQLEQRAVTLGDALSEVLADGIYFSDVDALRDINDVVIGQRDVTRFRVFNSDGQLLVDSGESGRYSTGAAADDLGLAALRELEPITRSGDDLFKVAVPILADTQLIGGYELAFSTKFIDDEILAITRRGIWEGAILVVAGTALAFLVGQYMVRPVRRLVVERTAELGAASEQLRLSRSRVVNAQEEVRKAVAQQLHGPVQNRLLVATHWLRSALETADSDRAESAAHVHRAMEIIDDVNQADLRSAMRRLHPALIRLSLQASLRSLVDEFERTFDIDVTLDTSDPETEELWRQGLPEELRLAIYRVAEEALGNAFKHAHATRVAISLSRLTEDRIAMEVRDDGIGFDQNTTPPGFGIFSMHDYCGAAGGEIRIASEPGHGTTVISSFPVPAAAGSRLAPEKVEAYDEAPNPSESVGAGQKPMGSATSFDNGSAAKILIVDDQPDFCSLVRELLKPFDDEFRVVGTCLDGDTALRLVDERQPDLVLLDVEMPGLSGLETSREVRSRSPGVKVVLMSAYHEPAYIEQLADTGAVDFIPKAELSVMRIRQAWQRVRPAG